jgi:hypothetical protein
MDGSRLLQCKLTAERKARRLGERAALQTADIARRLMRGGELRQQEGASS